MIISTTEDAIRTVVPTGTSTPGNADTESGAGTGTVAGPSVRTGSGTGGGGAAAAWTCLVRRGMLHSECEALEHWQLPPGAVLTSTPQHGVEEAVLVLDGELRLATDSAKHTVRAGQLALLPHGTRARLVADRAPVRLLTVRTLTASVTDRLPDRIPELV
ncbi:MULTISPECIES: cupin domain-containing protein [unclassified Streptomyces]|uniref:cupin domain-containing protein n=1 Tax=unclassified Streptomyces TaxID=2593676 RepID=UPI001F04ED74|nr:MULTISPECIES: cupin domain-containing protein [unclassified Streptomyces]MCH0566240.1 cupin domain-containing protein [Streptomyces sp. MUM 2J]MCH0568407.1 cupin domain-containing protein [Streptomyces sp. MUM 136J]